MKLYLQEVLKRELKTRGVSINTVARECRVSASVLHGWLNGVLPSAKNIHHIKSLSEYFGISVSMLLFNTVEENSQNSVLFSSEFADGNGKYRIKIERIG